MPALEFEAAADYAIRSGGSAVIIARGGRILVERYAGGMSREVPHRIYSGTKGLWCVAAACADQDGILDLDEPASQTLHEWKGSAKETITVRQLLNLTAGLEPASILHTDRLPDRNRYALQRPLLSDAGDQFHYGPSSLQAFIELFARKLHSRGTDPTRYLQTRLLQPLGIPLRRVLTDSKNNPLAATGFTLTAREWLKFGNFLLRDGLGGPLPFLPLARSKTLAECFDGSRANPMFGLGFWLNPRPGAEEIPIEPNLGKHRWPLGCISSEAPADLIASIGSQGQRLYVIPSEKLVIVRLGAGTKFDDDTFFETLFGPAHPTDLAKR